MLDKIRNADMLVIGSPVYWHNICGSVRTLLDRFYDRVKEEELSGKNLCFIFQGAAPEKWMLEAGEYTMKRFAAIYGLHYCGMANDAASAATLAESIRKEE